MRPSNSSKNAARRKSGRARTPEVLELLRVKYLGRKGDLTQILRSLEDLDPELRRQVGQEANRAKQALEEALAQALADPQGRRPPGRGRRNRRHPAGPPPGSGPAAPHHPAPREICDIFLRLGFEVVEGPEVELD